MIAYRYNGRDQSSWLNPRGLKSNPNYLREKLTDNNQDKYGL